MCLPFGLSAKTTMAQFLEQLGDDHLKATYAAFMKTPTRATWGGFMFAFNRVELAPMNSSSFSENAKAIWASRDALVWYMDTVEAMAFEKKPVRIKLTNFKFNFFDMLKDMGIEILSWNLEVIVSGRNVIQMSKLPVLKGDLSEMSIEPSIGEIALNQVFDNDFISFRFRFIQNAYKSSSLKSVGEMKNFTSKFFEISRYELIAKTMETGECEIEFFDKNADSSITVKFYNLPAVTLIPMESKNGE